MKIDDLLREADLVIEKRASVKEEKQMTVSSDDEITKFAKLLMDNDSEAFEPVKEQVQEKVASQAEQFIEKVAESLALTEVLLNSERIEKIEAFEKKAQEAGYSQVDIDKFIVEKFYV